ARAIGAVDAPDERRVHRVATPRLGGLAILVGFLVPTLYFFPGDGPARALLLGAIAIAILGAIDDIWGLNPAAKLLGQVACAAVPVSAGLTIDHVTLPFLGVYDLGATQYVITLVWFVALVNMINFTDGVDGLAAGIAAISAATFALLAASLDRADPAILAAALAGACLGFLYFNFNPARIFMGDSGSMLLGFVLAGVAVSGVMKSAAAIALVAPLLILAIPILDTSFVVMKRIKHGLPVYAADRSHFHHRFLNIGWSQRRTVLAVYAWCGLMGLIAVSIRFVPYTDGAGDYQLWGSLALLGLGAVALLAAVSLIYVLEILKWGKTPVVKIVRERSLERARAKAANLAD
ncbi:MAG: undecaprenyl/decaprenyl-phosphate alpha-N-acetylglucosaminyl 1-phosphate transferase, partial [Thermoleophilia bacterium]|nr:undecaprenyl/decaprenyl-phosphate alpha-N-acetylglucosaminyl 1-phosphate transferase [Thermoleophilia bacterium]